MAVTAIDPLPATVQGAVPMQPPPLQPLNMEPEAGIAVSVTDAPARYVAAQAVPQRIPAGVLATVPAPVPAFVTVTCSYPS